MAGACFLVDYMTSSFDPTRQYFSSQYIRILRENTRFRALYWVSSVSGYKNLGQTTANWYGVFINAFGGFT